MACGEDAFKKIEDGTANTSDLNTAIGCLREEIRDLSKDIQKTNESAQEFAGSIGDTKNVFLDMHKSVVAMGKSMITFSKDTQRQYKLAEQMAQSYKSTALSIGLSVESTKQFSKEFKGAAAKVQMLGGDLNSVSEIYEKFADNSGRVRILNEDEVENIYKLGAAAKMYGTESTELFESLDLMGVSNVEATKRMEQLILDSQKVGLNSSKVVKTLAQNMKTMQTYSFANGVKGMGEMAKLAVKMRLDVADMLNMSEKFYEPEGAIEAAANLQMLGGDIAKAFGDPFETMYLARNKPEELAKKLQDMTENMVQFNEETKQYEFPPEVRMQLKAAGDQLGIDVSKMTEMAMQTAKLKDVKMKLNVGGNITDESIQERISNMSRMEDGEFKVDFLGANGEKLTKTLDQLNNQDVEMIMKTPENEEDYMRQMIYNSQTTNERLKNMNDSFEKAFIKDIDVYKTLEDSSKKSLQELEDTIGESLKSIKESFKGSDLGQMLKDASGLGANFDQLMTNTIKSIGAGLELITPSTMLDDKIIEIDEAGVINIRGGANVTADSSANVTASNNTSSSSSSSSSSVINPLTPVNNNTASNNVIVPTVPTTINSKVDFGELVISGKIEVVSQGNTLSSVDLTNIKPELEKMIVSHLNGTYRNGGVPSSKETIDSL